mmetsp:Transcript_34533/g.62984  ORF Transcript_34533/g.62984 Transcript_34533/m.62984 type:complete len:242 (-) Transcript_34533:567-1292(-)
MDEFYSFGFVDIEDGCTPDFAPPNHLESSMLFSQAPFENTGRWTPEEHNLFLKALSIHGKNWKTVAQFVGTRSVVQVRTHAQKHFLKMAKCAPSSSKSSASKPSSQQSRKGTKRGRPRLDQDNSPAKSLKVTKKLSVEMDKVEMYNFLTPLQNQYDGPAPTVPASPVSVACFDEGLNGLLSKAEVLDWNSSQQDLTVLVKPETVDEPPSSALANFDLFEGLVDMDPATLFSGEAGFFDSFE